MLNVIGTAFTWGANNIKVIGIVALAAVLFTAGVKVYGGIKKLGQYEVMIKEYSELIKDRDNTIAVLLADRALIERLTVERDAELQKLEEANRNNLKDLPPDILAPAPESLKEYFRRLQK